MKNILLLVTFSACGFFCQSAFSQNTPWLKVETIETILPQSPFKPEYAEGVKPSSAMAAALKAYNPDFVPWTIADFPPKRIEHYPYSANSLPYAVKGDFNGDGITDLALAGHDKTKNRTVVLLSVSASSYSPVALTDINCCSSSTSVLTPSEILIKAKKGEEYYASDYDSDPTVLPHDAIKTKALKYCLWQEKPAKLIVVDTNNSPAIHLWNLEKKTFSELDGSCTNINTKAGRDVNYCF